MPPSMDSPPLSGVKAIFFDLDDTLCAYWQAAKTGLARAFEKHGPPGFSTQQMVSAWATAFRHFGPSLKKSEWYKDYLKSGEPTRTEQMRLALAELGVVDVVRARQLSEAYARERDGALQLFPESREVLQLLKEKFPIGLITNGPANIQRQEIETLQIESFFQHILIEGEMERGKPDQEVFEQAQRAVGQPSSQILMVGNSYSSDIAPAIAASWRTVWVRRPTDIPPSADPKHAVLEKKPESMPDPDWCIRDLRELLPLLGIASG